MQNFFDSYVHLSRLSFVFQTIGDVFLKAANLTSVVKKFVCDEGNRDEVQPIDNEDQCNVELAFAAETQSLLYLHPSLLTYEKKLFKQFHDFTMMFGKPIATILMSDKENCSNCNRSLVIDKTIHPVVIYSLHKGTYLGSRVVKTCRKCKIYEHYGYQTKNSERHYDERVLQLDFLLSTEDTAFDMDMLKECSNLLILGAVPFSTYAASYNRRFHYQKETTYTENQTKIKRMKRETPTQLQQMLEQRLSVDRRRLEEGFLLLAALEIIQVHKLALKITSLPCDRNMMVEQVTKEYSKAFVNKWGDHICEAPGCKSVLVMDGNMKNARQVCMLKDCGQLNFSGIPGTVVVGCQNTPSKASRYCTAHCGSAIVFQDDMTDDVPTNNKSDICIDTKHGSLIVKILNERSTRQGKLFEVLWADGRKSWLKESNLPQKVLQCIRNDTRYGQSKVTITEFGQSRTEYVDSSTVEAQTDFSPVKSSGFAIESDHDVTVKDDAGNQRKMLCGTEKGKHKSKNHRTAGILAIAKPCSIVVDVKELFGSESKTQVYAHLHDLLRKPALQSIETICYDDACHLKKFTCNHTRSSLTETSKRMAAMQMVCDKFHFKNHVDAWCKKNCNPYNADHLQDVNTEVCEQLFSWLSRFAPITKHMNRWRFLFLMLYILDSHNTDVENHTPW